MGLALSSMPERSLLRSAVRNATASPSVHLTEVVREDSEKTGEKKKKKEWVGECSKGQSSPDTFLSSSLYKVKCCLRFIAVKRKVNHIINKKKSNYSLWWSNIAYNKSLTYKDLNLHGS